MYKIKLKKYIALLLSILTFTTCLSLGSVVFGDDDIVINEVNFPDDNFRKIVLAKCDTDGNLTLQPSERTMTSLPLSSWRDEVLGEDAVIENLKGIEYFNRVTSLTASSLGLTSLDLSSNASLITVRCSANPLTSLTLGSLPNLRTLDCSACELTSLDVSSCTKLSKLFAFTNKLSSIDVSRNTALNTLSVYQNELTSLDLTFNTVLNKLYCNNNHISELNLGSNSNLAVNESDIGQQWIDVQAILNSGTIYMTYSFMDSSKLISTTLDQKTETPEGEVSTLAYNGSSFYASELTDISDRLVNADQDVFDGFSYRYDVGNSNCEPLSVNVVVNKDFYQVNFYTDSTKSERLKYQLVRRGASATAPTINNTDQCREFNSWSENFSNVQQNLDVYAVWDSTHNIIKIINSNTGDIDVHCTKCDRYTIKFNFAKAYNKRTGEDGFAEIGDMNKDGIINAKDYAIIKNLK